MALWPGNQRRFYAYIPPGTTFNRIGAPPGEAHCMMMEDLCALAAQGGLKAKHCETYPLRDYQTALNKAMTPFAGTKQLINMQT